MRIPPYAKPSPERLHLKSYIDRYMEAMEKRDFAALPVSDPFKYSENCELIKLGESRVTSPVKETIRLEIIDTTTHQTASMSILAESGRLITFFLRLKIKEEKITEIETLVNQGEKGVPIPFDPGNIKEISKHWHRFIRPAERDTRYALMDVAETYWRAMETEGTADYVRPPLLPDTDRFENGMQTANTTPVSMEDIIGDMPVENPPLFEPAYPFSDDSPRTALQDFDHGVWKGTGVLDIRHPVVDEELGLVVSLARFGSKNPDPEQLKTAGPSPYVAEFFAVTRGWVREIHVVIAGVKPSVETPWPIPY